MSFFADVKRGAKVVAKEAETRTQLALKHAEAANLRSAVSDALAEAGREVLRAYDAAGGPSPTVALGDRARALLDEARRLEVDLERLDREIAELRAQSAFSKPKAIPEREEPGAPRA